MRWPGTGWPCGLTISPQCSSPSAATRASSLTIGAFRLSLRSPVLETTLRLAEFETAKETLGMLLAARSRWIFEEEAKPHPNAARIGQWTRESEELFHRERALRFDDTEAIDEVIRHDGPQVRALHEGGR